MTEYCPDCIVKLEKQSKKLGCFKIYLVCPQCGYRTRPKSEYIKIKELNEFLDNKEKINNKHLIEDE
jgi:NMD protein affecting ribosome stability and mRNA decay